MKLFTFPYRELKVFSTPIKIATSYRLEAAVAADGTITVSLSEGSARPRILFSVRDSTFSGGFFGLNVWQASVLFQNAIVA